MITVERSQLVKEMITQLVVYYCLYWLSLTITITIIAIVIDLSKQLALDADPKAMQQISFTAHLDRNEKATTFFIIEEVKETILDFSQATIKVL